MAFSIHSKPPAPPAPQVQSSKLPQAPAQPAPAAAPQAQAAAPASTGSKLEDAINQDTNNGGGAAGGIGGEKNKWDGDSGFDLPGQSGGVVLNPDDLL